MKTYRLVWQSGVKYLAYDGETQLSDSDLSTLFTSAGSAYFIFDWNGGTVSTIWKFEIVSPTNTSTVVMSYQEGTTTGAQVSQDGKYCKGTWTGSTTTFATFDEIFPKGLNDAQWTDLFSKIKSLDTEIGNIEVALNAILYGGES